MSESIDEVVNNPYWLCIGFDPASAIVHFIKTTPESLEQAVFLEPDKLPSSTRRGFALQEVIATLDRCTTTSHTSGLVIHTAFACSTLLARCLQSPGRLQVLRELPVFSGLARARDWMIENGRSEQWPSLLAVIDRLSMRPFFENGVTFNKPSNTFLAAVADFMAVTPATRAVVIHTDLPDFLVSCLKKLRAGTAPWESMSRALDPNGRYSNESWTPDADTTPLQWACAVWHLQMILLTSLSRTASAPRIKQLPAERFLAFPEMTVASARDWLSPGFEGVVDEHYISQQMARHAKQPDATFGPHRRLEEIALANRHFGRELQETISWSDRVFGPWNPAYRRALWDFEPV
jgi:hypothetical protein